MRCVCSFRVIPFIKRTKKLCAYKRYNYIVLSARFWMTANPATACAVLVRVFTDTLNVACLRGLSPFLPIPRGSPVTIEPHMQNASTFPPASATRPRKVVQFRYARPESGILTTVLFDLSSITPARPLSREKRCTRPRPPSIEGETVQVGKSVCTCQGARRTPSGLHAIRGAPRALYGGHCPCQAVAPARMGDCRARRMGWAVGVLSLLTVPIIARGAVPVNSFLKKIFQPFFSKIMKTHARVGVHKTGENR